MKNIFLDMPNNKLSQALEEYEEWAFDTGLIRKEGILAGARNKYKESGLDIHIMERDLLYAGAKRWHNTYKEGKV